MPNLYVDININKDELLKFYSGDAKILRTKTTDGRVVQLPVDIFRKFVTQDGIYGVFEVSYDDNNKFVELKKLEL